MGQVCIETGLREERLEEINRQTEEAKQSLSGVVSNLDAEEQRCAERSQEAEREASEKEAALAEAERKLDTTEQHFLREMQRVQGELDAKRLFLEGLEQQHKNDLERQA